VAYAGETTLKESMQQILNQRHPIVELHFLDPIYTKDLADKDRRTLTLHIQDLISTKLGIST
ncbi:MAG: 1-acyl-sn-glycerol-3-phosphate acyltransferase, partial [Pseudomonadota bacterium]